MPKICQNFLYKFDFVGPSPQLFILKEIRYKSILSSIISLIIVLLSIIYTIFSLNEYFKYNNPNIIYSKGNDEKTKRKISIKDTLLMFQFVDSTYLNTIRNSIAYFEANYLEVFNNGTYNNISLDVEICEFGKNVDNKYKDFIRDKTKFEKTIDDFYCINYKNDNLSLFYYPNIGYSSIELNFILNNCDNCTPEKLQVLVISETDLINHNDKENPITRNYDYHLSSGFSSLEFTTINYIFQYLKYESDDGFFIKNSKIVNGMSFSDIDFYKKFQNDYDLEKNFNISNNTNFGKMEIEINKSYYDNYQRSYQKFPSLLAEVMTVVNLIFEIGSQIIKILSNKKMSKDIIEILLKKKNNQLFHQNQNLKNLFKDSENNQFFWEGKNIVSKSMDNINNIDKKGKSYETEIRDTKEPKSENFNQIKLNNDLIKKINYFHILKSYFCFSDNKTKLINLYHNIIKEDMSVEKILERFYNLDNIFQYLNKEEIIKLNDINNNGFKEINIYNYDDINNGIINENDKNISNKNTNNNYDNKTTI